MSNLLIIGAGQYGFVAKDVACEMNCFSKIDFLDDNNSIAIDKPENISKYLDEYDSVFVAVGNPVVRKRLFEIVKKEEIKFATLIHPTSVVAKSAEIGEGCIVEANAVVNSNSVVGDGTLICAGTVVNHNCIIGDFCHIDANSTVKSNSSVPNNTKVEAGTVYGL